ncbi:flagellar protein FliT [Ammoniphilus sp. 3BR4]|uniref:flagellar protein FliT n=1 Tax=Ammoniphilus sp. 3BR4 TaxID=3158265 RepID=UPI003465C0D4
MYIHEKKRLLELYLDQTLHLEKIVQSGEYERLEVFLGKRASIIEQIDTLDAAFSPADMERARQELLPLLAEMIRHEARVKELMQMSLEQLKAERNRMNAAKKVNQVYQAQGYSYDGAFFDKKVKFD